MVSLTNFTLDYNLELRSSWCSQAHKQQLLWFKTQSWKFIYVYDRAVSILIWLHSLARAFNKSDDFSSVSLWSFFLHVDCVLNAISWLSPAEEISAECLKTRHFLSPHQEQHNQVRHLFNLTRTKRCLVAFLSPLCYFFYSHTKHLVQSCGNRILNKQTIS